MRNAKPRSRSIATRQAAGGTRWTRHCNSSRHPGAWIQSRRTRSSARWRAWEGLCLRLGRAVGVVPGLQSAAQWFPWDKSQENDPTAVFGDPPRSHSSRSKVPLEAPKSLAAQGTKKSPPKHSPKQIGVNGETVLAEKRPNLPPIRGNGRDQTATSGPTTAPARDHSQSFREPGRLECSIPDSQPHQSALAGIHRRGLLDASLMTQPKTD